MRFTAIIRIIGDERGLAILNSRENTVYMYYLRYQRVFNAGGSAILVGARPRDIFIVQWVYCRH